MFLRNVPSLTINPIAHPTKTVDRSFRLWKIRSHGSSKIAIATSPRRSRWRRWLAYSGRCQRVSGRFSSRVAFFAVEEKERRRRRKRREKKERESEREDERQERREAENGRPANGWGVMSHRPVILKLPFNIPAASVVTRKEVRGHTSDFVEATTCLCSALRCTTPKSLVDEAR